MKTKLKPKLLFKPKKSISRLKILTIAAVALVVVATIVNSLALAYLFYFREINLQNNSEIISFIISAHDQLNKPTVIEPVSGKLYLPEAKLVLPVHKTELGDIAYRFSPIFEDQLEEVNIISVNDYTEAKNGVRNTIHANFDAPFKAVPKLQACSRGIRIAFAAESDLKPVASKKLSNGRTAYFYNEELCKNPKLLEYVKQIDSY